jgi:hypothetical protein
VFRRGEERFRVAALPGWDRVDAEGGDLAWLHPSTNAVIATNATCRAHKDPPLGVLMNDLLIGTTERKFLLEENVPLDGREAKHAVVAASVDGVPLVFDLYVLKKDGCVYDVTLVTPPAAYETVADEFVHFVAGFQALGERS